MVVQGRPIKEQASEWQNSVEVRLQICSSSVSILGIHTGIEIIDDLLSVNSMFDFSLLVITPPYDMYIRIFVGRTSKPASRFF